MSVKEIFTYGEQKKIFRQESLKCLSSPDDLNDVLKVVNPSSWAVLISVLLILAGFFAWSLAGSLEKKIYVTVQVSGGVAQFTLKDDKLQSGMPVVIGDTESVMRDTGTNKDGDYIGSANVPNLRDGTYEAGITLQRTSPMGLLFD